ncbi:MAG: hypothetical protein P1V19_02325 [Gimesia sp.]|nr:hypothetical protein [Gimesia sp.]
MLCIILRAVGIICTRRRDSFHFFIEKNGNHELFGVTFFRIERQVTSWHEAPIRKDKDVIMNQKWLFYGLSVLLMIVSCVVGCAHPQGSYPEPYIDPGAGRVIGPASGGSGSLHESLSTTPQSIPHSAPQGSGVR